MQVMKQNERQEPLVPQNEAAAVLSIVARAAADPNVDIDKLERLMAMQERALDRQAEQEFNTAMNGAQARMGRVATNQTNSQTHSKYADYAALDRVLRPIYTEEGFSLSFGTGEGAPEGCARITCRVSHKAGHSRDYQVDMPVDGKGAKGNDVMTKTHAMGAGMAYGMRYLLKGIFNVAVGEADTDGNMPQATPTQEAKAADFLQAIADAGTVAHLKENVGSAVANSGLPGPLKSKIRAAYSARLQKLTEAEGGK